MLGTAHLSLGSKRATRLKYLDQAHLCLLANGANGKIRARARRRVTSREPDHVGH
jgi:hypothetical protein